MSKRLFLTEINTEIYKAREKFPPFNSQYEGYTAIKKQLNDLWECIKEDDTVEKQRKEAIQIAATAVLYAEELC